MSEWKEYKLGDLIDVKHGFAFKGTFISDEANENILVTPGNFHIGGGFKNIKFKYYKSNDFPQDYILNEDDVVVTMTDLSKESDTLGYSAKIPKSNGVKYLHNQRIGLVQFKSKIADKNFLNWLMRTRDYQGFIVGSASGTSIMHTSPSRIKEYKFLLPPLPEQTAIAEILSSLDDKIDLLHRQNQTLEQLAETLFRQWFVEEAEVSWEEKRVWDIAEHFKENISPSKYPDKIFHHFSLPAFDEGKNPKAEIGKDILSNKYKVIPNSILISKLNPRFPRIWELYGNSIPENSICSTEFQIAKPKDISLFGFLYCFLKSNHVTQELVSAAGGTSGSHQRVNPNDIFNLSFIMPSKELIERFHLITKEYFQKIKSNTKQIKTLTRLRDTLLPKLMSGEVRVN